MLSPLGNLHMAPEEPIKGASLSHPSIFGCSGKMIHIMFKDVTGIKENILSVRPKLDQRANSPAQTGIRNPAPQFHSRERVSRRRTCHISTPVRDPMRATFLPFRTADGNDEQHM